MDTEDRSKAQATSTRSPIYRRKNTLSLIFTYIFKQFLPSQLKNWSIEMNGRAQVDYKTEESVFNYEVEKHLGEAERETE